MAKETPLHDLFARVRDAHACHAPPVVASAPKPRSFPLDRQKPKPERPAIAEKVKRYFDRKFIARPDREKLCDALFGCKVWPTEEILLEDLVHAKYDGDANKVALLRDLVHANSWSSHKPPPPHDELIRRALKLRDHLSAMQGSLARANPEDGRQMDEQIHEGEVVLDALRNHIDDERAEAATRAIERWMDEAWRGLAITRKSMPFSWEGEKALRRTRPQLRAAMEKIEAIREIRDQLYYQRLYPNLFREGKEPPHHDAT